MANCQNASVFRFCEPFAVCMRQEVSAALRTDRKPRSTTASRADVIRRAKP